MRPRTARTLLALSLALALPSAGGPAGAGHVSGPYFDLGALPPPTSTGAQMTDGLDAFVNAFPYRVVEGPTETLAAKFLRDEAEALGYQVRVTTVPVDTMEAGGVGVGLRAVTAFKPGTTRPNEWILLMAHYDTVPQTIFGAYDNGSGTNLLRFLARDLLNVRMSRNVPTNRSLMFVWFNGEEEGVLASRFYAQQLRDAGQTLTAALGFDMEGIAWPVATPNTQSCLCMWHGANDGEFRPLLEHVNFGFLGFPSGTGRVRVIGVNDRNSDESSFAAVGYPTLRWAGIRTAAGYTAYHRYNDTLDTIYQVAGGRSYYEAGYENTLKSAYYTLLALDNHLPVPAFTSAASGLDLSVDARSSSDEDGALASYSWDFGDGGTATGATASHTYAAADTYTVTLTVADNLWPAVTRQATAAVTV